MATIQLAAWRSVSLDVIFDPRSGGGKFLRLASPRPDSMRINGFADWERSLRGPGCSFAIYLESGDLYFSAGKKRWLLPDRALSFTHREGLFASTFCVQRDARVEFSFTYLHLWRSALAAIDPTYDGIDFDSDYFLGFIARYALTPEWQRNVRERWPH